MPGHRGARSKRPRAISGQWREVRRRICSLVLCSIKDEREVEEALDLLRQALTESGHLTIVLCDPFSFDTNDST